MARRLAVALALALGLLLGACASTDEKTSASAAPERKTDAEWRASVVDGMHTLLLGELDTLVGAARELETAFPDPPGRGWDATADARAITDAKDAWYRARSAYERIEGAIAPLFPDIDVAIDARYDDFLTALGPSGDPDPFDGEGVTGMHALERILWADSAPERVVAFESTLPGYASARFPATATEASEMKAGLAATFVADVTSLRDQWTPVHIHPFIALQGLTSLMNEQREKVRKASTNEEESRYSQRTMVDIRDNLDGARAAFGLFEPWLLSKTAPDGGISGTDVVRDIRSGFARLTAAYAAVKGDAFPSMPATWSSEAPTAADLSTPFGELFSAVDAAVDPNDPASVVSRMTDSETLLGFDVPE